MPNGHGGHVRFFSVIVLLVFAAAWLVYVRSGGAPGWAPYAGYPLAALIGERVAHHLHRWHAQEYDGSYLNDDEKAGVRKTYLVAALLYIIVAVVAWDFLVTK